MAFGCPCDEVDCDLANLSCWGDEFNGKCWEQDEPPDWVCIERCELISFFDDAFKSVCVGPHLGDQYEGGSAYYLTKGAFQGHPAYCTSIDCGRRKGQMSPASAKKRASEGRSAWARIRVGRSAWTTRVA